MSAFDSDWQYGPATSNLHKKKKNNNNNSNNNNNNNNHYIWKRWYNFVNFVAHGICKVHLGF